MISILVVSDNQNNQKILCSFLQRFKMDFSVAGNPAEVLKKIENEHFDCILMDITLPDFNEIEISEKIRVKEKIMNRRTPIAVITSNVKNGDKERILDSGIDYYIPKPLNEQHLFDVLFKIYSNIISKEAVGKKPASTDQLQDIKKQDNVINRVIFDDTFNTYDKETALKVIDLYISDFPKRMLKLKQCLSDNDVKSIVDTSHSLKGVVSYFGAPDLYDLIRRFHLESKNGILDNLHALFNEFDILGQKMIEELKIIRHDYI